MMNTPSDSEPPVEHYNPAESHARAMQLAYYYALETLLEADLCHDAEEIIEIATSYSQKHWSNWLQRAATLHALPGAH